MPELKLVAAEDKQELVLRLARIEGQIRGIREMIEREESCERVAQQLAAARQALSKAFSQLVARTIQRNCGSGPDADPAATAKLATIAKILATYG
ncbi:MAG TPA: metal-sensing transcriptional repressor [Gemmatimonadales bacterium]|nr:metal-sensing transcriptional repressor [Gemmatimonadales bacterium]